MPEKSSLPPPDTLCDPVTFFTDGDRDNMNLDDLPGKNLDDEKLVL